uniref:Uncharacterized protein n=1 Tax=Rousettus aegyptiacus TaxID=9407 RepID=A0A7J8B8F1_ROUAE|nr:hypothetical protein HJG63_010058 [Rousettus aegyptiacus]
MAGVDLLKSTTPATLGKDLPRPRAAAERCSSALDARQTRPGGQVDNSDSVVGRISQLCNIWARAIRSSCACESDCTTGIQVTGYLVGWLVGWLGPMNEWKAGRGIPSLVWSGLRHQRLTWLVGFVLFVPAPVLCWSVISVSLVSVFEIVVSLSVICFYPSSFPYVY